jgi:hypothetical protein
MNAIFRQNDTSPEKKQADMSPGRSIVPLAMILILPGLMLFLSAISPLAAQAQGVDYPPDSSCYTCHEESYPVFGKGEWHEIHARKDCCWNCHGGNSQSMDKDLAHVGLVRQPLEDMYTDCYACHPYDYPTRAERFAGALGVVPVSQAPTPRLTIQRTPGEDLQLVVLPTTEPVRSPAIPWYPELICLALALMLITGLMFWSNTHTQHIHP